MNFLNGIKYLVIYFFISNILSAQNTVNFAVIGDYGNAGADLLAVSNLVKSWNPDFVITVGDNNYDVGSPYTIDQNIGQYFHEFIYPYYGVYGKGAAENKFFPSMGNCDWGTPGAVPYLDYFTLPGNERYYDFIKGPVHFFVLNTDTNETDGRDSSSLQAMWLKEKLKTSSSRYNVVYFHHAPYCSGLYHGSDIEMRWPFKQWGASVVLSGHEHVYERLNINGMTYFVNGLGGNLRSVILFPISGSQVRYTANYGAMKVNANNDSMVFRFINIAGSQRDVFTLLPASKTLSLNVLLEGFYNEETGILTSDTVSVGLHGMNPPYTLIESKRGVLSNSGLVNLNFSNASNFTDYYINVNHRNCVETWSISGNKFILNNLNYDFTITDSSAFGRNLILKGNKYCIYSGDVNQDGIIDGSDLNLIDNDAVEFASGYISTDLNGDNFIDGSDISIASNNAENFIIVITP